jgi:DNA-binding MarR family transcriptional regulator
MANIIEKLGYLSSGSRFRRIYEQLQLSGDRIYKDSGLDFKSSWFPVYYTLSRYDRPLAVMEIADQIAFSHITVNNIVKELHRAKLITIEPNAQDKRSKLISLTKKGKTMLDNLKPIWIQISASLKEIMTAGHPDMIGILENIDKELQRKSLHERVVRSKTTKS